MTAAIYPIRHVDRVDRVAPRPVDRPADAAGDGTANYAVRRAVAVTVGVMIVVVVTLASSALFGALAGATSGSGAASASATPQSQIVRIHVAQPGDTLWSIAERYRGEVDQGRFVDALIDVNSGTVIQIGQAVRLP